MTAYICRRLLQFVPVLIILSLVIFVLLRVVTKDPLSAYVGADAGGLSPQARRELTRSLGLDKPQAVQYVEWLGNVLRGNWGRSLIGRQPIGQIIRARLGVTVQLGVVAWLIAVAAGVPAGILSALRRNSWLDVAVTSFALAGIAIPNFVVGLLLIIVCGVYLHLLPTTGAVQLTQDPVQALRHLILPALALGLALMAGIARQTRSAMLEVLREDFVRPARAKGLRQRSVIWRHAFRNAVLPVLTIAGISAGHIASGAVIIESLFGLGGIGSLVASAIVGHDYLTVQVLALVLALFVLVANLVTDILYGMLDPRIRIG